MYVCLFLGGNVIFLASIQDRRLKLFVNISIIMGHIQTDSCVTAARSSCLTAARLSSQLRYYR